MGLQEWPGIIPFDQAVLGSRVTPQKGERCDGAGSLAWPFSGHSAQWLSGPGTAQNPRRGSEHQRESARIPARGTRRGPRSRHEPGGNATLRTRNPKTKRPRVPSAPGSPPPAAHAHAPLGPALEGGGRLPVPGGRRADTRSAAAQSISSSLPDPGGNGPQLRAAPLPAKGRSTPLRGLEMREGPEVARSAFRGSPWGRLHFPRPARPAHSPRPLSRRQVLGTGSSSWLSGPESFYESFAGRFLLAKSLSRTDPD